MISVIVPVYNLEKYISRTLDSILAQTYQNIEIIVVNDGSDDRTKEILDDYATRYTNRIIVIHIQNGGVTNARLTGVKHAKGEWIGFVDGDDIIAPDMYQRLMSNAIRYDADISHCGYQMVFDDGRTSYFHNTGKIIKQDTETSLKDLLQGTMVEPGLWNKLFKRELFLDLILKDALPLNIKINEDLLMNYLLFKNAKISIYEDFCPYHYVVRQGSATRRNLTNNKIYDPIRVKKHILNIASSENLKYAREAYLRTCISVYNEIVLAKTSKFDNDGRAVRGLIIEHFEWKKLLGTGQKILSVLIRYLPAVYKRIYPIYDKYFLKNPYV